MKRTIVLTLVLALGVVAGVAKADFVFGTPTNLGVTGNPSDLDGSPSISADGLSLYFTRIVSFTMSKADIYVTQRASASDPWGEPVKLGPAVNSSYYDGEPSISSDGLSLYFGSQRPGGSGGADIWVATRATVSDPWEKAVNLGPAVNTWSDDVDVCISADGLSLYIDSFRDGGYGSTDIWVATRETLSDAWSEPINLGPTINTTGESAPSISADGRVLFFSDFFDPRPGGQGDADLWMTSRATVSDPWGEPVNLGPAINSPGIDAHPDISADGSTLYFTSDRPRSAGFAALWQVSITPVVDFNGDGKVDGADVLSLAAHWGQNYPACDIGPTPLGDGVVDVEDLRVLAEHVGAELTDSTLLAHWALNETEGAMAHDSVGDNDATIMGAPAWRPHAGAMDGALELNGMTFLVADFVLNPADGPFSVLTWIKGGAPGQAVVTQQSGANWLMVDPATGALMTELESGGRNSEALCSDVVITDGNWHRIGFTWEGSNRRLYVDDILVAEDTDVALGACNGGLNIGCGKVMSAATFFTGLIDDIRIYNRAVEP